MPTSLILIAFLGATVLAVIALAASGSGSNSSQEEVLDYSSRQSIGAEQARLSTFANSLARGLESEREYLISRVEKGEIQVPLTLRGTSWQTDDMRFLRGLISDMRYHLGLKAKELGGF